MRLLSYIFFVFLPLSTIFATPSEFERAKGSYEALKEVANEIRDGLKYLDSTKNYKISGNELIPASGLPPKNYLGSTDYIPSMAALNSSAKNYFQNENLEYSFLRKMVFNSFKSFLEVVPEEMFNKIKELNKDNLSLTGNLQTMTELKNNLSTLLFKIKIMKNAKSTNPTYTIKK